MRRRYVLLFVGLFIMLMNVSLAIAIAPGPRFKDGGNKHNLSSSNTGVTFQAVATPGDPTRRDTQTCTFCHTPHNSVSQSVLWNRKDPTTTFGRYSSASLIIRNKSEANFGEPTGSSRLCLSCHDGVTALGDVLNGPLIDFGASDKITGIGKFDAVKVKSGHHPVSFVYDDPAVIAALNAKTGPYSGTYRLPDDPGVPAEVSNVVKLKNKQMQCTTCHDPHQNQSDDDACYGGACGGVNTRKIAPFWVLHKAAAPNTATDDHDSVCTACHPFASPAPFPWP